MASKVRKVVESIGGAESPKFKEGLLHAVVMPSTGELHMYRDRQTTDDPINPRPWELKAPLDEVEAFAKWLMSLYGDFDGDKPKYREFT